LLSSDVKISPGLKESVTFTSYSQYETPARVRDDSELLVEAVLLIPKFTAILFSLLLMLLPN
ncbi:MAG: hypothetical protein ACJAUP_001870, partial [Cellvibrionaceae bacterium]